MNLNFVNESIEKFHQHVVKINLASTEDGIRCLKELFILENNLLTSVEKYLQYNKLDKNNLTDLFLYLIQQHYILCLYEKLFKEESKNNGLILKQVRNCCFSCFEQCSNKLKECFNNEFINDDKTIGGFIKWMDISLNKLSLIDVTLENASVQYTEIYEVVEEVLCHAMSIAQISCDEDSKMIKGCSKAVLDALKSLNSEINKNPSKKDIAMCNLLIDLCCDELCVLERKVNTAVLRLCLKVFGELSGPLDAVNNYCSDKNDNKSIDLLIESFDFHVDRIIHVCLFAISCSTNDQYIVKLKANLASIEALEAYLVPSFLQVLKNANLENTKSATLLKNFWLINAKSLKKLIYNIIEPSAFCKVVYDELKQNVTNLNKNVNNFEELFDKSVVYPIISQAKVLREMIKVSLDYFDEKELEKFIIEYEKFKAVLEEIETATNLLLDKQSENVENRKRVLKRCKILLKLIKNLWYLYLNEEKQSNDGNDEEETKNTGAKSTGEEIDQNTPSENDEFNLIVDKGKQLLADRSIMYRTPKKLEKTTTINKSSNITALTYLTENKSRNRSRLPFSCKKMKNDELALNDTITYLKSNSFTFIDMD